MLCNLVTAVPSPLPAPCYWRLAHCLNMQQQELGWDAIASPPHLFSYKQTYSVLILVTPYRPWTCLYPSTLNVVRRKTEHWRGGCFGRDLPPRPYLRTHSLIFPKNLPLNPAISPGGYYSQFPCVILGWNTGTGRVWNAFPIRFASKPFLGNRSTLVPYLLAWQIPLVAYTHLPVTVPLPAFLRSGTTDGLDGLALRAVLPA